MALRLRLAHSWWLASELVRRHGDLRLIEAHGGGGQADSLWLLGPGDRLWVNINRIGGVHFPASGAPSIPFDEFFGNGEPYAFIGRIESEAGLTPRGGALPSSPKILAYRTAAHLMMVTIGTREPLDIRNHFHDSSGSEGSGLSSGLRDFPLAEAASRVRRLDDIDHEPGYRYWLVGRGGSVMAVLDTDGNAYQGNVIHHLPHEYQVHNRNLTATLLAVFPSLLP